MRHARHYTRDEARTLLPWVATHLRTMRDAQAQLTDTQARQALHQSATSNGGGHAGKQVGEAFLTLQRSLAELDDREIVLRDLDRGLIDFPSLRGEEEVYLCWIDGEADLAFWHGLDAGYGGRQPLD